MAGGLGTHQNSPTEQHIKIDLNKRIIHPQYNSRYLSYDLCMLKVSRECLTILEQQVRLMSVLICTDPGAIQVDR